MPDRLAYIFRVRVQQEYSTDRADTSGGAAVDCAGARLAE